MKLTGPDVTGIVGAIILMIAFLLLQLGRLSSNAVAYSVLNAVGASLIVFSLLFNFNLSAFIIEVFWIAISLVGLFRVLRTRHYKA
jgi:multidrug transporter EmrE-like cation transporter